MPKQSAQGDEHGRHRHREHGTSPSSILYSLSAIFTHVKHELRQAGAGNVIGSKFAEIASIIDQVEDKSRVGVCLDTCQSSPDSSLPLSFCSGSNLGFGFNDDRPRVRWRV